MKKIVALSLVMFVLSVLPLPYQGKLEAKPAYCTIALERCYDGCDALLFLRAGCATGCGIGYLTCG